MIVIYMDGSVTGDRFGWGITLSGRAEGLYSKTVVLTESRPPV